MSQESLLTPDPLRHRGDISDLKENIPGRIRTCNLRLRRPTLYPIELRGRIAITLRVICEAVNEPTHADSQAENSGSLGRSTLPMAPVAGGPGFSAGDG